MRQTSRAVKAAAKAAARDPGDAEKQLEGFIAKFEPERQALIRAVRRALRRLLPAANELVWDNYNFFVIGYSATERPSDSVVSLAAAVQRRGPRVLPRRDAAGSAPDSPGLGTQNRFIRLESAKTWIGPKSRR